MFPTKHTTIREYDDREVCLHANPRLEIGAGIDYEPFVCGKGRPVYALKLARTTVRDRYSPFT